MILKEMANVLRVGIVASFEDRVETLMHRESICRDFAISTLGQRDQARKYFFKKFFEMDDPDSPDLFHFTINTSEMSTSYAADMVVQNLKALSEGRLFK